MLFHPSILVVCSISVLVAALPHANDDALHDVLTLKSLHEPGYLTKTPHGEDEDESGLSSSVFEARDANLEEWKATVLRTHNAYRAQYGAPDLTWSNALYSGTAQWASQCKFQHSNGGGKYGENLAAGSGGSYGYESGLKAWMDEASRYSYIFPEFSLGAGHFTQVVWKSSTQVACAVADCAPGTIFGQASKNIVCRYSPPGNFLGRYAENVGRYQG